MHCSHNFQPEAQLVESLIADPGVVSLILAQSHTFVEIDHHEINFYGLAPPSADSRRVDVSYKRHIMRGVASLQLKYVHARAYSHMLKFGTLVSCQKGLDKQGRHRSDCF